MREMGYYWVKEIGNKAKWEIMRWDETVFHCEWGLRYTPSELTINEERINSPDEK